MSKLPKKKRGGGARRLGHPKAWVMGDGAFSLLCVHQNTPKSAHLTALQGPTKNDIHLCPLPGRPGLHITNSHPACADIKPHADP